MGVKRSIQRTGLVDEVAQRLRRLIKREFCPGECLPTVRQLAQRLGVSTATLRAAQAVLCKEGFLEPRHGSGVYVKDRAAHWLVAVVSELNLLHPHVSGFYRELVSELRSHLQQHRIRTRLYLGEIQPGETLKETTCPEFLTDLRAGRFDGVIPVAMSSQQPWMEWTERMGVPVVGLGGGFRYAVMYRPEDVFKAGLELLRAQGCRRVGVLWWGWPEREQLREMVEKAGLEVRREWLRNDLHPSIQGAGWDEFREIWTADQVKPDGLLVTDDVLFEGVVDAVMVSRVRVPEDIKIVLQAHRSSLGRYPFPLIVLADDPLAMGRAAAELMQQLINGVEPEPRVVLLRHEVVALPAWGRTAVDVRAQLANRDDVHHVRIQTDGVR